MSKIKVVKNEHNPEGTEVLAEAIIRIGEAAKKLGDSGLNEKAIIILIHHETKISLRDIRTVINSLKMLRGWYCRKDA